MKSKSLYVMAAVAVQNPPFAPDIPSMNLPKYWDTFLNGKSFVAFFFNNNASALVSTEDNNGLNAAADVLRIDPATLDTAASSGDLSTLFSFSGVATGAVSAQTPAQTYRSALQSLNGGSPIVLTVGSRLTI